MNHDKLDFFERVLIEKMNQILGTAEETMNQMSQGDGAFPDPTDRAVSESNRTIELRTRDRERKLLQKILKAIGKIKDGTYGICEECGDDISESRLKVRPEATLCLKCKEEEEKVEKQFGL